MMKTSDSLEDIWNTYQVTLNCLKITERSVKASDLNLLKRTSFATATIDSAKLDIQESRKHIDDYLILSLWAVFERNLFDCAVRESQRILNNNPTSFTQEIQKKIERELEYWRVDDVLDIFKVMIGNSQLIDSQLIGQAKQIKCYRDWIAHKNPKKPPLVNVVPQTAYRILQKITRILETHPATAIEITDF